MMVPKKLHCVWVGNEKTENVKKCIASFHQYMSDYEIIEWSESNIDTEQFSPSLKKLYEKSYNDGKFAFCSDIARLYILKQYGGIYVDTDVEFIKHLPDEFLTSNFIGRINPTHTVCNGCIWACEPNNRLVESLTRWYSETVDRFFDLHGRKWIFNTILVQFFELMGDTLCVNGITEFFDYKVYPVEYFCPQSSLTGKLTITPNTISIHHFDLSWKRRIV